MAGAGFRPGDVVTVAGVSTEPGYGEATILDIDGSEHLIRYEHYQYSDGQEGAWGPDLLDYHSANAEQLTLVSPSQEEITAAIVSITKTALERIQDAEIQQQIQGR